MGNLKIFEEIIESKLLNMHTAYLAKIISTNGKTAKIQPLGMTKAYGEKAQAQSVLSNVPIAATVHKVEENTYTVVTSVEPVQETQITVPKIVPIGVGDIVVCICCERDISDAKNGKNSVPVGVHHSMSSSVIVGVL